MKVLIRFDDICPTMDWGQWAKAEAILLKYDIKPLIGVIPDCMDPTLQIDQPKSNFWNWVREKQQLGYEIAMHGFQHVYDNQCKGVISKGVNTEFAGHPYEVQLDKIRKGRDILMSHSIETDVFFAPSHSYDFNTLKALAKCGFKYVSDGKSISPIIREGIVCVPCRDGGAFSLLPQSHFTFVFHANEWSSPDKEYGYHRLKFVAERYQNSIVSFNEYANQTIGNKLFQELDEKVYLIWDRYIYSNILGLWLKIK